MEKTYRLIVLVGLLVGLVVNAVATFRLKGDIADLQTSIQQVSSNIETAQMKTKAAVLDMETDLKGQIAEHERLISQLENMMNYQLDQ